jgi:hypothetical protein
MAQAGYTPLNLYYSSTATNVPLAANMGSGELALNTADGKLFYKSSAGVVTLLVQSGVGSVTTFSAGTTGFTPSTATTGAVTLSGTLANTNGGTGQSAAFTQYGITYASTTTALATTAAGTSTTVLHGNASGAPTFGAVTLTADVSGTLPIANGGTNSTATPTAGGIGYGTGTAHAYTAVGTSGQALISAAAGAPAFGTLGAGGGGTGQTSAFTQYGIVYGSSTSALATTAAGTTTTVLHGNAAGAPSWGAISLSADVTGTLAAANGGTGQATYAVGDILYASSTTALSKLPIGTANQILTVNTGATAPQWATGASSGVSSVSFGTTGLTPSTATTGAVVVAGTLATTNGGTGLITFNANGAVYASSSSVLTTGTLPTTGGGTGLASFTANGAVYASSTSALTTGTLPTASGGTGLITYTAGDIVYSSATNTLGKLAIGTAGQALVVNSGATAPAWTTQNSSITFIIDGGGVAISAGIKGDLTIPFNCTITEWTLLCDQSGSIVVDIWKDVYANYPPTVANTITASAKPTVTTSVKNQSTTLTGWTATITAGDTLRFNVNSATTVQRVTLSLKVYRT